jgi:hypothetical protein
MNRRSLASLEEVAEYLGLPSKTVRDQVYRRVGVGQYAFRVGKYLRWEWADVDAFVQSQKEARSIAA